MPTINILIIPADDDQPLEVRELERGDLRSMQEIVGGYIEAIDIDNPSATIILNGEGKVEGLPVNQRATAICWIHNSAFRHRDVLVGSCFITGRPDSRGETTSAPDWFIELVTNPSHYRLEVQTIGSDSWSGNGKVFDTWLEAYTWGLGLAARWLLVSELRIIAI